jgi:hypothetical protein
VKTPGQVAFEAYTAKGWVVPSSWDELSNDAGEAIKAAWECAAEAVAADALANAAFVVGLAGGRACLHPSPVEGPPPNTVGGSVVRHCPDCGVFL